MFSSPATRRRTILATPVACAVVAVLAAFGAAAPARASVTVGSDLTVTTNTSLGCSNGAAKCTYFNTAIPGRTLVSPTTGVVVRWRMKATIISAESVAFRVLHPVAGGKFVGAGSAALSLPAQFAGVKTTGAQLPIQKGDLIGLDAPGGQGALFHATTGATLSNFAPPLPEGGLGTAAILSPFADELALNADVAAPPTSSASVPAACPATGAVAVTVTPDPDPSSGAKAVHFRIDGGAEQVVATTGSPGVANVNVPAGDHSLEYWGEDVLGQQEAGHHTTAVSVGCPAAPSSPVSAVAADRSAPLLGGLFASPARFAVANGSTARVARTPRGTHFRFRVSENARVRIVIQRRLPGRRSAYRSVGTLQRSESAGSRSVRFSGRVGSKALRPGRYRALVSAADTAGNRSRSYRVTFQIVR